MINPFDGNFFKFFIGFVLILSFSFGILYFVGKYTKTTSVNANIGSTIKGVQVKK